MDLAINIEFEIQSRVQAVDKFVENYLRSMNLGTELKPVPLLSESMIYSAMNGGKRFRPLLSILVAEALGGNMEKVLPFACAVEFIHTYSLIHDDLPCMDNDDIRRGKPTNHKVYGEDFALLAGDALLTEAFALLATHYSDHPALLGLLVKRLSEAAGIRGMVGGQAIDLRASDISIDVESLKTLHAMKTGALISVAVEGAALIAGAKASDVESLIKFGQGLGLAFQVADDILDHGEANQGDRSFTEVLGVEETKKLLSEISRKALSELHKVTRQSSMLEYLINFNQTRKH